MMNSKVDKEFVEVAMRAYNKLSVVMDRNDPRPFNDVYEFELFYKIMLNRILKE